MRTSKHVQPPSSTGHDEGVSVDTLWAHHHAEWRDPADVIVQWREAGEVDPRLLHATVQGAWWETLATRRVTLLVTREYEHLVLALRASEAGSVVSYVRMPHPSGLAVDRERGRVHVASTRNPNQIFELAPVTGLLTRTDVPQWPLNDCPLVPVASRFYPGSFYLHDLALVGGVLHANAVGHNAIVRFDPEGGCERVWWPKSIETEAGPAFDKNYLQVNSIAAGPDLANSYFSASAERPSRRRPGHRDFPVDGRGVIFSGATREPIVRGLTRPHSARLHEGRIWVDNSGYGELVVVEDDRLDVAARLPGWTRGLCFVGPIAFVGTSRVIPRFRQYAPGLDVDASVCGIHAVDTRTGTVLGSISWPNGNQIFALDWAPDSMTAGLPFVAGAKRAVARERALFYAFTTNGRHENVRPVRAPARTVQPPPGAASTGHHLLMQVTD
ncbi:MAG: DUF4915 domain-containing protein [Chloroflexi bacterium]|nr:DUF4915 domain-containing protein [Chloroflexota bacterium]